MPRHLLYLIVFIEGFCSLGAEVIALRRLVPHVGSAIVVTAPTIGLFLLALALGYAAGARVADRFTAVVGRNFVVSALLAGVGLSRLAVDGLFGTVQPVWLAYLLFMGLVLCPLAWLLGFGLFRLFDIVKPWPIRWLDARVKGGFGVMLDDVLAALMAWLTYLALVNLAGLPG
jgi:predicted membrane-bound spermidine synthase